MKGDYFKGKKVTLMGLGLLGRGVGDAKFLAEQGADLIVTDLKSEEELKESLEQLKEYDKPKKLADGSFRPGISYTLGEHKLEDFRDKDLIIKGVTVPLDSEYIAEAKNNGIRVEMSTALLVRLLKKELDVTVVGVTGTRGKSTVTQLIYDMCKEDGKSVYIGGNVRGMATLPLIEKVSDGDILVLELDSWQLQGFTEDKISPDVSIFTNFYPDHQDYYKSMEDYWEDKSAIFAYQTADDHLIVGTQVSERIPDTYPGKLAVADSVNVPNDWNIQIPGEHNRENIALAVTTAQVLSVSDSAIQTAVESFKGISGRLEYLGEVRGVKVYNDNSSTTPEATLAALKAIGDNKKLILIMGGTDKGLDRSELIAAIPEYCKAVVLFNEVGTEKIKEDMYALDGVRVVEGDTPKEIVEKAFEVASAGDTILYSPAFTSFGKFFANVYDRGEQFVRNVEAYK